MPDEDLTLNDEAFQLRYSDDNEMPEENEPEVEEESELEQPTSSAAAEDTGDEVAGDEETEGEVEAEDEVQEQPTKPTKAAEETTAGDDWKSRFEELQAQLNSQSELFKRVLEKETPAADPDLLKLFGGTPEEKPAPAPVQQAAQPQIDPIQSALREHMVTQPLQFFQSEDELRAFNSGDMDAANRIFSRIFNTALEGSARLSAKIIPSVVGEQTSRQSVIEAYFRERPHLAPHKGKIGAMVTRYSGLRPDLSLAEIMTLLTPEINREFGAAAVKANTPAAPRGPRGPKPKPQGGRFQPGPAKAQGDASFDLWLDAKNQGRI